MQFASFHFSDYISLLIHFQIKLCWGFNYSVASHVGRCFRLGPAITATSFRRPRANNRYANEAMPNTSQMTVVKSFSDPQQGEHS